MDMTASPAAMGPGATGSTAAPTTPAPRADTVQGRLACLLLLAVALGMFALNVHHGLGIYPDSTRYMGLSPTPYDAPVYHWMVIAGPALGSTLLNAAMVAALAALCANVVLVFALAWRGSGNWRIAALATALVILSPQFVTLHSGAMSEAPFMTFLMATIWFALNYFDHGRRRDLLLASTLLGVATLTRFTAPPLGAAIALVILSRPGAPMTRRLIDCVLLALVGGALFFGWVAWSTETTGHSIGRELRFYGNMDAHQWGNNIEAMAAWLFPDQVPLPLRLALLVALVGFAGWQTLRQWQGWRSGAQTRQQTTRAALALVLALLVVFYLAFVWLSTALEANLGLSGRYAFPAYVMLVLLLATQAGGLDRSRVLDRRALLALGALAAVVLASHAVRSASRTAEVYRDGFGYHSRAWRESPTVAAVGALPRGAVIYSNAPEVPALLVDRRALATPHERELRTNLPEPGNSLAHQFETIRRQAAAGPAPVYVVFFDKLDWRFYLASEEQVVRGLNLRPVQRLPDGRVYLVPSTPSARR